MFKADREIAACTDLNTNHVWGDNHEKTTVFIVSVVYIGVQLLHG